MVAQGGNLSYSQVWSDMDCMEALRLAQAIQAQNKKMAADLRRQR